MIGKHIGLLITVLFLGLFSQAQVLKNKKDFLSYHITNSIYPPSESGLKNPDGKEYSYGFGIQYWKSLKKKIRFSAGFHGTFSNFTPLFIKDDQLGAAAFTNQLDGIFHIYAFREENPLNVFLSAGVGLGLFSNNFAVYAPGGTGISYYFPEGFRLLLQAQIRQPLTAGITKHYMFYSLGFAQSAPRAKMKKLFERPVMPTVIVKPKDTDEDGIVDSLDLCPNEKGLLQGCPDIDNDLIANKDDRCPDIAGLARYQGCPIPDTDDDGFNDEIDSCVNIAGKLNGCPDRDFDGIADKDDECPDLAGINALRGCPEITREVKDKVSYAARNILFRFASDELLESSKKALNEVVEILKRDTSLKLNIEAHADNRGTHERNLMWSEKRSLAVANYFKQQGISAERLTSKGFGDSKPIADNNTEEGRAQNRRVELILNY
jgi:outer membrane protein OmpA-like peptidoglycan-associated protein